MRLNIVVFRQRTAISGCASNSTKRKFFPKLFFCVSEDLYLCSLLPLEFLLIGHGLSLHV